MALKVVNFAPHPIAIAVQDGLLTFEPCGVLLRAREEDLKTEVLELEGHKVEFITMGFGPAELVEVKRDAYRDLVERVRGERVVALVSELAFLVTDPAALARHLGAAEVVLAVPNTGPRGAIRDTSGRIVAVRGLRKLVLPRPPQ